MRNAIRRAFICLDWATMTHGQRYTAELLNDGLGARLAEFPRSGEAS